MKSVTTGFSGETFKDFEVLYFSMSATTSSSAASFTDCVMTLYLSKVHLQTFPFIPITQKFQILTCETLVANERYNHGYSDHYYSTGRKKRKRVRSGRIRKLNVVLVSVGLTL